MGKGKSIAGMVLGIVSLVICWFGTLSFFALPMAIVGLILSINGGKQLKANNQPSGIATTGVVLGIIAVVLSSITFIACGLCVACIGTAASTAGAF